MTRRNRRFVRIIAPLLMFFLYTACAGIDDGGGGLSDVPVVSDEPPFVPFASPKYEYRIDIPREFDMEGMEGRLTSWSYIPPMEEGETVPPVAPRISVIVTDIPKGYSSRSLFNTKAALLEDQMNEPDSSFRDLRIVEYSGGYALMVDSVDKSNTYAENHRFYYLYIGDTSYLVDISGTASDLKRWKSFFDHVIESFQVIK